MTRSATPAEQQTVRTFLALPPGALASAVSDDDNLDNPEVWGLLGRLPTDPYALHVLGPVLLRADADGWRDGVWIGR